ncbi:hypothetical protein [uncultured Nitrospira sp.]|uniref:hypothetical protein n=1 Tax=uncultured Nitrospira sp. TaxID=157176 RepID=UPI003140C50F
MVLEKHANIIFFPAPHEWLHHQAKGDAIDSGLFSLFFMNRYPIFPWPSASLTVAITRKMVPIHTHHPVHHRTPADFER